MRSLFEEEDPIIPEGDAADPEPICADCHGAISECACFDVRYDRGDLWNGDELRDLGLEVRRCVIPVLLVIAAASIAMSAWFASGWM